MRTVNTAQSTQSTYTPPVSTGSFEQSEAKTKIFNNFASYVDKMTNRLDISQNGQIVMYIGVVDRFPNGRCKLPIMKTAIKLTDEQFDALKDEYNLEPIQKNQRKRPVPKSVAPKRLHRPIPHVQEQTNDDDDEDGCTEMEMNDKVINELIDGNGNDYNDMDDSDAYKY